MQNTIDKLQFEIGISSLQNIIIEKLQELNIAEVEFLRNFQTKINYQSSHSYLVYYFRSLISHFEQDFKDVKGYFHDLKIQFIYDFFRKMQIIMINGINLVSQALMLNIKQNQQQKEHEKDMKAKENLKILIPGKENKEKKLKSQLEQYDRTIIYYENEEKKINDEMQIISQNIWLGKNFVQKLQPSRAVKELNQIRQISQELLENTQKIFEDTYQLKFLEFKDYLSKIRQSEDISQQFCKNIQYSLREKFAKGIKKTVHKIVFLKEQNLHSRQIETETQTQCNSTIGGIGGRGKTPRNSMNGKQPDKLHHLFLKQRKNNQNLAAQNKNLAKLLQQTSSQKENLSLQKSEIDQKLKIVTQNYKILQNLYEQKKQDLYKHHTIQKQLQQAHNKLLNQNHYKRKVKFEDIGLQIYISSNVTQSQQTQTVNFDNETIIYLRKYITKMKMNMNEQERNMKEIDRQNNRLKRKYENDQKMNYMKVAEGWAIQRMLDILICPEEHKQNTSTQIKITLRNLDNLKAKDANISNSSLQYNQELQPISSYGDLSTFKDIELPGDSLAFIIQQKHIQQEKLLIRHRGSSRLIKISVQTQTGQFSGNFNLEKAVQTQQNKSSNNKNYIINHQKKSMKTLTKQNDVFNKTDGSYSNSTKKFVPYNTSFNFQNKSKIFQNPSRQQYDQDEIESKKYEKISSNFERDEAQYARNYQLPKNATFQVLNIENQQSKQALTKRKDMKKIIMDNKKHKQSISDVRHKTLMPYDDNKVSVGQNSVRQHMKMGSRERESHLINVDKMQLMLLTSCQRKKNKTSSSGFFRLSERKTMGNTII